MNENFWKSTEVTALMLATYSELAYESLETVQATLPEAKITLLDRDNTQAYIIQRDRDTIVAFRGTQVTENFSMGDIVRNAQLDLIPLGINKGSVHEGYKTGVDAIADDLKKSLVNCTYPLIFTGHSLGGASATYARTLHPWPDMTITFGAPKAGDKKFVKYYSHIPHMRFAHGRDIAPKWPRPWRGYAHGETFIKVGLDGKLTERRWRWYDELIIPIFGGLIIGTFDHRIGEYITKLRGAEV